MKSRPCYPGLIDNACNLAAQEPAVIVEVVMVERGFCLFIPLPIASEISWIEEFHCFPFGSKDCIFCNFLFYLSLQGFNKEIYLSP